MASQGFIGPCCFRNAYLLLNKRLLPLRVLLPHRERERENTNLSNSAAKLSTRLQAKCQILIMHSGHLRDINHSGFHGSSLGGFLQPEEATMQTETLPWTSTAQARAA